jgi:hypothetical protein
LVIDETFSLPCNVSLVPIKVEDASEDFVRFGGGRLVIPTAIRISGFDMGDGPDVDLDVSVKNGRLVVDELRARPNAKNGIPVTAESLRVVRVRYVMREAVKCVWRATEEGPDGEIVHLPARTQLFSSEDRDFIREHGLTNRTLRTVADLYRAGLLTGTQPTKLIEQWLDQPRSTVGRWIAAARERGYLGETEGQGKAGEVQG